MNQLFTAFDDGVLIGATIVGVIWGILLIGLIAMAFSVTAWELIKVLKTIGRLIIGR